PPAPRPARRGDAGPVTRSTTKEAASMTTGAIYARVSGQRQKEEQTIGSQIEEATAAARSWGIEVPPDWIFTDEGYTGATLVRPALERLRDLAARVPVDVVICFVTEPSGHKARLPDA